MHPNEKTAAWPSIAFDSQDALWRAFIACEHGKVVPAGCYFVIKQEIRVETEEQKAALLTYLAKHAEKNPKLADLRQHYRNTGRFQG